MSIHNFDNTDAVFAAMTAELDELSERARRVSVAETHIRTHELSAELWRARLESLDSEDIFECRMTADDVCIDGEIVRISANEHDRRALGLALTMFELDLLSVGAMSDTLALLGRQVDEMGLEQREEFEAMVEAFEDEREGVLLDMATVETIRTTLWATELNTTQAAAWRRLFQAVLTEAPGGHCDEDVEILEGLIAKLPS